MRAACPSRPLCAVPVRRRRPCRKARSRSPCLAGRVTRHAPHVPPQRPTTAAQTCGACDSMHADPWLSQTVGLVQPHATVQQLRVDGRCACACSVRCGSKPFHLQRPSSARIRPGARGSPPPPRDALSAAFRKLRDSAAVSVAAAAAAARRREHAVLGTAASHPPTTPCSMSVRGAR